MSHALDVLYPPEIESNLTAILVGFVGQPKTPSVNQLIRDAFVKGLRDAGYFVVYESLEITTYEESTYVYQPLSSALSDTITHSPNRGGLYL